MEKRREPEERARSDRRQHPIELSGANPTQFLLVMIGLIFVRGGDSVGLPTRVVYHCDVRPIKINGDAIGLSGRIIDLESLTSVVNLNI
jgi:hypothetical protein